jgi:hypothetical protein
MTITEIIKYRDIEAGTEQLDAGMRADKAGTSCD